MTGLGFAAELMGGIGIRPRSQAHGQPIEPSGFQDDNDAVRSFIFEEFNNSPQFFPGSVPLPASRQLIVELFPTAHRRGSRFPSRQVIVEIHGDTGTLSRNEVYHSATCCA
jgi:hypothetical protein